MLILRLLEWADGTRRLAIRANADITARRRGAGAAGRWNRRCHFDMFFFRPERLRASPPHADERYGHVARLEQKRD